MAIIFDISSSLTNNDGGNDNGFNWRQVLKPSGLSAYTGTLVRVTYKWGSACSSSSVTFKSSIGLKGGTEPNFAGDQVPIKFNGGNTISVGPLVSVVSDIIVLPQAFDNTKDYVVASWLSNTAPATVSFTTSADANEVQWGASVLSSTDDSNATTPTVTLNNVGNFAAVVATITTASLDIVRGFSVISGGGKIYTPVIGY
jgi:hypothetical protein